MLNANRVEKVRIGAHKETKSHVIEVWSVEIVVDKVL